MNRRDFLKGAVGVGALAAVPALVGSEMERQLADNQWLQSERYHFPREPASLTITGNLTEENVMKAVEDIERFQQAKGQISLEDYGRSITIDRAEIEQSKQIEELNRMIRKWKPVNV